MTEVWLPVRGYEGKYEVSNSGKVRSLNYHRQGITKELTGNVDKDGYRCVLLRKDNKRKTCFVHRLVATAFIPEIEGKRLINHKDCNRLNNRADNLEWCDAQYNAVYADAVPKRSRAVYMIDPGTGEIVESFYGTREAERKTGIAHSRIIYACMDENRVTGGYKWKYAKEA